MKRILGYILMGIGLLLSWPAQLLLPIIAFVYVIMTFIREGFWDGVIAMLLSGVAVSVAEFAIYLIALPFIFGASVLLDEPEIRERKQGFFSRSR